MPPRPDDPTLTGAPLNPAEASMTSNGSNKRPRDEDDDLDDEEDDEGGKKERNSHKKIVLLIIQDERLKLLLSKTSLVDTSPSPSVRLVS
jgi:hypothetical protein